MMKLKKHSCRAVPVYRESGYLHRMKPVPRWEKLLWAAAVLVLLVLGALLLLVRHNSDWVERYYSLGFYPLWAGALSALTGLLPFSLAEWLVALFAAVCLTGLVCFVATLVRYRRSWGRVLLRYSLRLVSLLAAVALLFTMGGGLNYYRYSFTHYSGLEVRPSETDQLADLCRELLAQANTLRQTLPEDSRGVSQLQQEGMALSRQANAGYQALAARNQQYARLFDLSTRVPPKPVFFSKAMSYMQIVGFFFPYTIEANVNVDITHFGIPNAMTHELAHIAGFMREDEANFIAYLACRENPDPFFQYSGTMLALIHSTNALHSRAPELHSQIMAEAHPGVRRDLVADSLYYQQHDTKFGEFSTKVNDTYLKANSQTDGVASYGRMVDLLLADYRQRHNLT